MSPKPIEDGSYAHLAEVWGDTVDLQHLAAAVLIGAAISLGAYFGAVRMLAILGHGAPVDRAYAMLVGLAGCLLSCFICARIFPPKRLLVEADQDKAGQRAAVAALLATSEGWDSPIPDTTRAELESLGLADLLPSPQAAKCIGVG